MKTKQEYVNAYGFPGCILLFHNSHSRADQIRELFIKYGRMKMRLWPRRVRDVRNKYIETGVLGSYDTVRITDKDWNGMPVPMFEDTELKEDCGNVRLERRMVVGGKRFIVSSVFPDSSTLTTTDKMLSLIEKADEF